MKNNQPKALFEAGSEETELCPVESISSSRGVYAIPANLSQPGQTANIAPREVGRTSANEPHPPADLLALMKRFYMGAWCWSEFEPCVFEGARLSIAFSGWSDVSMALQQSQKVKSSLVGEAFIAFGGGDVYGSFNRCCIGSITGAIKRGDLQGYDGIAYCLQEGVAGLGPLLEESFLVAKAQGFKVLVSCAAPFNFADANMLMSCLLANGNIDVFSPQLYVSGLETENNYSVIEHGVDYSQCQAALVPSVVSGLLYEEAAVYFARRGVEVQGFLLS